MPRKSLIIMDGVLLILCVVYWLSLSEVRGSDYWYPVSVTLLTACIVSAHLAVTSARALRSQNGSPRPAAVSATHDDSRVVSSKGRIAIAVLACLVYIALLSRLGMVLDTAAIVIALGSLAGWRNWRALSAAAVLLSIIVTYLFGVVLGYPLPMFPEFST